MKELKVRLQQIINSDYKEYFKVDEYISKGEYVRKLFNNDRRYQIVNFNLNNIDDRFSRLGPSHSCYNYNPYVQEDRWKVEHVK